METLWSTSWTNRRVRTAVTLLLLLSYFLCIRKWLSTFSVKQPGVQSSNVSVQKMVTLKIPAGRRAREDTQHDGDENGLDEQHYVQALGTHNLEGEGGSWVLCLQRVIQLHIFYLTLFVPSVLVFVRILRKIMRSKKSVSQCSLLPPQPALWILAQRHCAYYC